MSLIRALYRDPAAVKPIFEIREIFPDNPTHPGPWFQFSAFDLQDAAQVFARERDIAINPLSPRVRYAEVRQFSNHSNSGTFIVPYRINIEYAAYKWPFI